MRTIFFSILLLPAYALHAASGSDSAGTPLQTVEYYLNDIEVLRTELIPRARTEKVANDLLGDCLLTSRDTDLYFERVFWEAGPWHEEPKASFFSEYTHNLLLRPFNNSDVAKFE